MGIAALLVLVLPTLVGWGYFAWFAPIRAWKNELDVLTVRLSDGPVSYLLLDAPETFFDFEAPKAPSPP